MDSVEKLTAAITMVEEARGVPLSASCVVHRAEIARDEARKILDDARETAEIEKAEVEEYIDGRLATLEVILNKTMDAVSRGRDRLAGANDKDVLSQLADEN